MATPSNHVRKTVPIYAKCHPKGIEYSWDKRKEGKPGWQLVCMLHMPIRHNVKRHVYPALYMALTSLP